jgi:hypothetical protein
MDGILDLLDHGVVAPRWADINESKLTSHSRQLVSKDTEAIPARSVRFGSRGPEAVKENGTTRAGQEPAQLSFVGFPVLRFQLQPSAARSVRHPAAIRASLSVVTCLRNASRGNVRKLSKLTTDSTGIPSASPSSNSETRLRRVRVSAATTT